MKSFMFLLSIFMIMLPVVGKNSSSCSTCPKRMQEEREEEEEEEEFKSKSCVIRCINCSSLKNPCYKGWHGRYWPFWQGNYDVVGCPWKSWTSKKYTWNSSSRCLILSKKTKKYLFLKRKRVDTQFIDPTSYKERLEKDRIDTRLNWSKKNPEIEEASPAKGRKGGKKRKVPAPIAPAPIAPAPAPIAIAAAPIAPAPVAIAAAPIAPAPVAIAPAPIAPAPVVSQ